MKDGFSEFPMRRHPIENLYTLSRHHNGKARTPKNAGLHRGGGNSRAPAVFEIEVNG